MYRKVKTFTDEEKARIVERYMKGDVTQQQLANMIGVANSTICKWVASYTTCGTFNRYNVVKKTKTNINTISDNRDIEIAKLKAALEKAELRAKALDIMIDVAEENFKIQIRKKAGTKQ